MKMSTNRSANGNSLRTQSNVLRKLLSSPYARLPKSCIECRRRKKSCEGGVPGCDNCKKRGTVHLCKYGDERDEMEGENIMEQMSERNSPMLHEFSPNERSGNSQIFHGSPFPLQDTSRLERLSNAAIEGGRLEENQEINDVAHRTDEEDHAMQFTDPIEPSAQHRNRDCMPKWRSHLRASRSKLPTKWQADQLITLHRQYLSFGGLMMLDDERLTDNVYFNLQQPDNIQTEEDEEELSMNINDADASSIALILVICASALSMLPLSLTFPITIGTSLNANDNERIVDVWTQLAVEYFDQGDLYRIPRFEAFEALVIYEYNLLNVGNRYSMIHRLDIAVRIGRILGLDRLGSADDDQKRWDKLDRDKHTSPSSSSSSSQYASDLQRHDQTTNKLVSTVPLNTFASGEWASKTFAARNHRKRECGRSLWSLLTFRDWNSGPQAGGTYNIHPSTFTTQWPKTRLVRTWKHSPNFCSHSQLGNDRINDVEECDTWPYIAKASESFRQFIDLSGEAAVYNEDMRYEDMLKLDKSLMSLLDSRPEWIRPETGASRWRFGIQTTSGKDECKEEIEIRWKYIPSFKSHMDQCCSLMNLLSSTLWHKLFIIHRPFLSRSLSQPDVYGLTQHRTIYGSLLLLECCNQYTEESNTTVLLFRLQHAAIALISMLLLQGAMFPNARRREAASRAILTVNKESGTGASPSSLSFDSLRIHKGLSFAIQALKNHGKQSTARRDGMNTSNGVFHGLGDALEQLLNTAGRLEWRQRRANSRKSNIPMTSQNGQAGQDSIALPSNTAHTQSRLDLPVVSNATFSDTIPSSGPIPVDMTSPAQTLNSTLGQTPSSNEYMQNQSISQLDQDLFRLLGGQFPSQNEGNDGANNVQLLNSFEPPTKSSVAPTQLSLNDGILPERPPWVQEDLWQSIFETLNNWNV